MNDLDKGIKRKQLKEVILNKEYGYNKIRELPEESQNLIVETICTVGNNNLSIQEYIKIQAYSLQMLESMFEANENTDNLKKDISKAIGYGCLCLQTEEIRK